MTITLQDITRDNWAACVKLKVADDQQKFVASNVCSLAESKYESGLVPQAIYAGDVMVGFLMWGHDPEDPPGEYWIVRLMVAHDQQGKGYGRAAMQTILGQLWAMPGYTAVLTSYVPNNQAAAALYANLGFEKTGQILDGEIVVRWAGYPKNRVSSNL